MFDLSQVQMKRLTAIHGWSAVVLGLLLYAVIATGAVAVFADEIGRWSVGGVRERMPLEERIDAGVRALAAAVEPEFLRRCRHLGRARAGTICMPSSTTTRLNPKSGWRTTSGRCSGRTRRPAGCIERHDGFVWNDPAAWETSALRQFLVDLHVQLYLPDPWGLILTGILGLMMMAAVISGLLMHRHLDPRSLRRRAAGGPAGVGAGPARAGGELGHCPSRSCWRSPGRS